MEGCGWTDYWYLGAWGSRVVNRAGSILYQQINHSHTHTLAHARTYTRARTHAPLLLASIKMGSSTKVAILSNETR